MNPTGRMPAFPEAEAHLAALIDHAERENLKRFIDTDMEAWGRYNTRVHGIHQRLYWLLWRKKNENLERFGRVAFEIVFKDLS
jgi:hypothetical protein